MHSWNQTSGPVCWRHTAEDADAMRAELTRQAIEYVSAARRIDSGIDEGTHSIRRGRELHHILKSNMLHHPPGGWCATHPAYGGLYYVVQVSDDPTDTVTNPS